MHSFFLHQIEVSQQLHTFLVYSQEQSPWDLWHLGWVGTKTSLSSLVNSKIFVPARNQTPFPC